MYKDFGGDGGVSAYRTIDDGIEVRFKGSSTVYRYRRVDYGSVEIERLILLAKSGDGLTRRLNQLKLT